MLVTADLEANMLIGRLSIVCVALATLLGGDLAYSQTKETVLYSFGTNGGTSDGWAPSGALIFDSAGNMYGATSAGGGNLSNNCPNGCGTVFELSPISGGGWSESILHAFAEGEDGVSPLSGLVFDTQGNLYGTTVGLGGDCQPPDCGTVFELSPTLDGAWTETTLYSFTGFPDGYEPLAPVTFDAQGNLFGTTSSGGANNVGTVFELSPPSFPGGNWSETIVYSFCQAGGEDKCSDGAIPYGGVVLDGAGNLYGTTLLGGTQPKWGVVYELTPTLGGGTWTESVLHNFNGTDGGEPEAGLSFDEGNLYGTVSSGGLSGSSCLEEQYPPYSLVCGGAFRLTPKVNGGWSANSFLFQGKNGGNPQAGLSMNGTSAFGTTFRGGTYGRGTVFSIVGNGNEKVLHSFCQVFPKCYDGTEPAGVTLNGGVIYGITQYGGVYDQGVVFSIEQ